MKAVRVEDDDEDDDQDDEVGMSYDYDVVIIGAGPGGLGAALYTCRALLTTLVIERLGAGGQIVEAYNVDNYLGFPEGISGPDLAERMKQHAVKFGAGMRGEEVRDVRADGPIKIVVTDAGEYRAPIVIVATGASHRKLGVPGEKELAGAGVSYCATCDGMFYRGKRLLVVGGGDAALTEAVFLTRFASEINLIHRRQEFRAGAVNIEEARRTGKIEFVLDTVVTRIVGDGRVQGVMTRNVRTGEERRLDCDGVFVFVGHEPNTAFLRTILPRYAGRVIPTDMNMETDVPGLYAVGDVRMGSYRQVATAVSDGVVAAMHAERRIKTLVGK
jgi:thioredoxin reductase (NADPH)